MTEATTEGLGADLQWDLADRLRKALRVSGVGVQEMADELEVERNTVGRYINGRGVPNRATLVVWALKTGVPIEWLTNAESPRRGAGGGSLFLVAERGSAMLRGCRDSNPRPSDP
ncbi:helix-turn-helix domain-containing protein [Nocardioides baekrokdamisoli]|uniref:helix-turn-helix domain-containing protein n=1 Tax=Nocardioides baekrokdamisoli TaxID=1804624 RepID=UPI0038CD40A5